MKITYKSEATGMSVELEGETQKDLFKQLATFQEVFDEEACGKCGHKHLKFTVRNVDDNEYYELRCPNCGARLSFGSHKKGGTLFPKRKGDDGWLPDNGWVKWNPQTQSVE